MPPRKDKDKADNATLEPPPPIVPPKDNDTKALRSMPSRGKIPRVDDLTRHLGDTINSAEFNTLLQMAGSPEAAFVMLARCLNMNIDYIKSLFKDGLVSFAQAKYSNIAPLFWMSPIYDDANWKPFTVPRVSLPSSVKEALLYAGIRAFKQSGPPGEHANEHARVRFLGAWLSILISLFDGCVYDIPEKGMPGTHTSTGGQVEYEMFVWQRTIVFLIEVKFQLGRGESLWNQLAQVMCELDSACQMNRRLGLQDFPIYAILTDCKHFHFLAFDGTQNQFFKDTHIELPCAPLGDNGVLYLQSMIAVCNRIFGVLLQGYMNTLKAYENKSVRRGLMGDDSKTLSSLALPMPVPDSEREPLQRGSTKTWQKKVSDIEECQQRFQLAYQLFNEQDIDQAEETADLARRQLRNCVRSMDYKGLNLSLALSMIKDWKEHGNATIDV